MSRRHSQTPDDKWFVCVHCKAGRCYECIDVLRAAYTNEPLCRCKKSGHSGEITDMIKDPETGTVYTEGMTVTELGEVALDPVRRQAFLDQFAHMLGDEDGV